MRKRKMFMLTVLTTEKGLADYCGQVKVIADGKTKSFTSLEELNRLICLEMNTQTAYDEIPDEIDIEEPDASQS